MASKAFYWIQVIWAYAGGTGKALLALRCHSRYPEERVNDDDVMRMEAYIYDAVRTPRGRGKPSGGLHLVPPLSLAKAVFKALPERGHFDTNLIEDVIMGCVEPVGEQGGNIARIAALMAGYGESASGFQINRFCSSGLEAVNIAAAKVAAKQADVIVAGGVESMSRVVMASSGGAWPVDPDVAQRLKYIPQGVSADLIASKYGYSRRQLDEFAVLSHHRAYRAQISGYFDASLVSVNSDDGCQTLTYDELIRPDTSVEQLMQLSPSFASIGQKYGFDDIALQQYPEVESIEHHHHAGNSSSIADGAAVVLVGSKKAEKRLGFSPRARILATASIGSEPTIMLTGPEFAAKKALKLARLKVSDIDLFEVNEAFASVVLRFCEALNLTTEKVNVTGGAIAMGHPLGATGAMLISTLLDEMERRGVEHGLVTLCVGAGMASATIIKRMRP